MQKGSKGEQGQPRATQVSNTPKKTKSEALELNTKNKSKL